MTIIHKFNWLRYNLTSPKFGEKKTTKAMKEKDSASTFIEPSSDLILNFQKKGLWPLVDVQRRLSKSWPGSRGWREAGHLLRCVVFDMLQAQQWIGNHGFPLDASHVQVTIRCITSFTSKSYRVIREISRGCHWRDVWQWRAKTVVA